MTTAASESSGKQFTGGPAGAEAGGAARTLFNRELSWLEFNRRVLEEARDADAPLLERLKFLAIFSSNLDEFFMVRVSGLMEELEQGEGVAPSPDGMSPAEQLREISARLRPMVEEQTRCLREEVLPGLAERGIVVKRYEDLSEAERGVADAYFSESVFPILTPQAVDPGHPFPYISNLSLNLGVMVEHGEKAGKAGARFARIKLPPVIPRLVPVDESGTKFVSLGSLVAGHAAALFPGMRVRPCHLFRVTRDADFEIREDEAADLLRAVQQNLRQRRFGDTVRLEVAAAMPAEMVEYLTASLDLTPQDVYAIEGPLNLPDLMQLYGLERPELKDKPIQVTLPEPLRKARSVFDAIRAGDILVHHPYTSYAAVTDFITAAAKDPEVLAIKMCLYRTGKQSPIVQALIDAVERGKQVAVLVELKARFDEESNIGWARRLEEAGVHVVYGLVGLKTHSKLALVVRREEGELKRYVHVATGNYNPTTSRIYTDLGIFTADEEIGADALDLFNFLTGFSRFKAYRCLLVAPVNLRERMTGLIRREAAHAAAGRPARVVAKMNSLTDAGVINELYAASQAGVSVDLIVRGMCMLRPGVAGLSENIRVRSIVGRFLEHSRVFYFRNGGEEEVYTGSADWMTRNLERRVEVIAPVKDAGLRKFLKEGLLDAYLRDNVKARELQPDGSYARVRPREGEEIFDSQTYFQGV